MYICKTPATKFKTGVQCKSLKASVNRVLIEFCGQIQFEILN